MHCQIPVMNPTFIPSSLLIGSSLSTFWARSEQLACRSRWNSICRVASWCLHREARLTASPTPTHPFLCGGPFLPFPWEKKEQPGSLVNSFRPACFLRAGLPARSASRPVGHAPWLPPTTSGTGQGPQRAAATGRPHRSPRSRLRDENTAWVRPAARLLGSSALPEGRCADSAGSWEGAG